ncbi:MAG: hypothetical protein LRZ97_00015, partial [Candidatus Pacebacteria bacterium]|nr:hypothetical protein [Candidatus Paceibacterota bacterium]
MSLSIIQKTIIKYWTLVSSKSKSLASLGFAYFFIFSVDIAHAGVASWVLGGITTTGILSLVILIPGLLLLLSTGMFNIS